MDAKVANDLRINIGAVKRLIKETKSYEDEVAEAEQKFQNSDLDVNSPQHRSLIELKNESVRAHADCVQKLNTFVEKLRVSLNAANGFPDDPLIIEANELLQSL